MQAVDHRLRHIDRGTAWTLLRTIDEHRESRAHVAQLRTLLPGDLPFERWLLVNAALETLTSVASLPLPAAAGALLCEEFEFFAGSTEPERFDVNRSAFVDMAKKATLRRFPAGQFDWEVSGIPRSYLLRVAPRSLWRVIPFVAMHMRGLRPVFFSHLNPRRRRAALNELDALQSYARMAAAMRLQPGVRGFAACSWFRSPDTHAVSPHLAWLSDVFNENGGLVAVAGPADPDCGVFYRSATRRRLFEEGRFKPTVGLVMWPRPAMLAWAAAHPEFAG